MGIGMKSDRQNKIMELISHEEISTQEELAQALNDAGFQTTQATVSRDIRELNLTKTARNGKLQYAVFEPSGVTMSDKFIRVLKDGFISMDMAQNILVIKTVPGMAMAVCAALDAMHWPEIVGSIAGDDTIMCAVRTVADTVRLMNKLRNLLQN